MFRMFFLTEIWGLDASSTGELNPIAKIPVQIGRVEAEKHTAAAIKCNFYHYLKVVNEFQLLLFILIIYAANISLY